MEILQQDLNAGFMTSTVTINESIRSFVRMAGANSDNTARTYRTAIETHFLTFLAETTELTGDSPVSGLQLNHARDFAAWLAHDYRDAKGRKLSANSRALYLTGLKEYYRHLILSNMLPGISLLDFEALKDSLRRTAKARVGPIEERLPDQEIIDALIETAKIPPDLPESMQPGQKRRRLLGWRRDLAIILTLSSSGMRVGEMVSLYRENLDHTAHGAWVIGKGDRKRFVRFSQEAWTQITTYLRERNDGELSTALSSHPVFCRHDKRASGHRRPISTRSVRRTLYQLAEAADITERFHLTPHTLRHYFATKLLRETNNLALTQDSLGHASPNTTRIYAKTSRDDLVTAHQRIFDRPANDHDQEPEPE